MTAKGLIEFSIANNDTSSDIMDSFSDSVVEHGGLVCLVQAVPAITQDMHYVAPFVRLPGL